MVARALSGGAPGEMQQGCYRVDYSDAVDAMAIVEDLTSTNHVGSSTIATRCVLADPSCRASQDALRTRIDENQCKVVNIGEDTKPPVRRHF